MKQRGRTEADENSTPIQGEPIMKTESKKASAAEQRAQYEAWYDAQVRLGLEDIEAGRLLSHEEVVKRGQEQIARLKRQHVKAA